MRTSNVPGEETAMEFNRHDIARMIDSSIVRPEVDRAELEQFVQSVKEYRYIGAHVLPYFVAELNQLLSGDEDILIGTGIGFPFGNNRTEVKALEARLALADGARELDMVINVSALLSRRLGYVTDEIKALKDIAGDKVLKVILEVHWLSDDDIKRGCQCVIQGGADFVKTATGHTPTGATPENIALMKSIVGDEVKIKASGGVRDLAGLLKLYGLGARRFGVGAASAVNIMMEFDKIPEEKVEV
jgi:deoxyribose-phosphate aldolase